MDSDLRDILDTLQELNQAVGQQTRVRVRLEAEKASLARRLREALTAERRQRCQATASRTFARRVLATTQPNIDVQTALVGLKRELATQKKSFQQERRAFEDKVRSLQREIVRLKEEKEAALAVADFTKEDAAFTKNANQVTGSTAVPNSELPAPVESNVPMSGTLTPPPPPPTLQLRPTELQPQGQGSPQSQSSNALWTGSGQLVWNPPPVNLTTRAQAQFRPIRPVQNTRYKAVANFRTASELMQACRSEEDENQACDSDLRVSQSGSTVKADEQLVPSDDDCVIIQEDTAAERQHTAMVKTEKIKTENPEEDFVPQERIQAANCVFDSEDIDTSLRPPKKPRKKKRMFSTPLHDDFVR